MTKKASNVKKNQSGPWLIDQVTPECPKPQSNHPRVRSQNIAHPRGGNISRISHFLTNDMLLAIMVVLAYAPPTTPRGAAWTGDMHPEIGLGSNPKCDNKTLVWSFVRFK